MNYSDNKQVIKEFYGKKGFSKEFEKDNIYLEKAFNEIHEIWLANLNQIKTVNYLMLAEAPLWGNIKKYIYNPKINNSQFFHRSDLADTLGICIADKNKFIKVCNEIGLLIVDISPFPLNPNDTVINYRDRKLLSVKQYQQLVSLTIPTFFEEKIKLIREKKSTNIKAFFRYARVKKGFEDIVSDVLIDYGIIKTKNDIGEISQKGGGIDKVKLKKIIEAGQI